MDGVLLAGTVAPVIAPSNLNCLLWSGSRSHALAMFIVSEAQAAAIRAIFLQQGEFSAAVELRRLFPGIANTEQA